MEVSAYVSLVQTFDLGLTRDIWATANFQETQLRQVRAGGRVDIEVDQLGKTFSGHVDSVAGAKDARLNTRIVVSSNCSTPADHSAIHWEREAQISCAVAPFGKDLQCSISLSSPNSSPLEFCASTNPSLYTTIAHPFETVS